MYVPKVGHGMINCNAQPRPQDTTPIWANCPHGSWTTIAPKPKLLVQYHLPPESPLQASLPSCQAQIMLLVIAKLSSSWLVPVKSNLN